MDFAAHLAAVDRAALSHLGSTVLYASAPYDEPVSVMGIFDSAYVNQSVGDASVSSSVPAVGVVLADLVWADGTACDPETDDDPRVTVGATTYRVREVQKDGTGFAVLLLSELDP